MSPETFEALASFAEREEEGFRLEFLGGRLEEKALSDGIRTTIVAWLVRQCAHQRPEWGVYVGLGLKVETHRTGRAIPAGTLAPMGHFVSAGEWAEPDGVLMTVEVTSCDHTSGHSSAVRTPGRSPKDALPSCVTSKRAVAAAVAAMIRPCAPRGLPCRRTWAISRA